MTRNYERLLAYIAKQEPRPFQWGRNDCVRFAAGAVHAQTGKNPMAAVSLRWSSERAAHRLLAAKGLTERVDELLTRVPPALAKRGDVAGVTTGNDVLLAIVEGDTVVAPGPNGLERRPRSAMTIAWSAD